MYLRGCGRPAVCLSSFSLQVGDPVTYWVSSEGLGSWGVQGSGCTLYVGPGAFHKLMPHFWVPQSPPVCGEVLYGNQRLSGSPRTLQGHDSETWVGITTTSRRLFP